MRIDTASKVTDDVFRRIRGEYTEMPGLRVTQPQAQRLWGLDEATCRLALDFLVGAGFLRRTDVGQYVRLTEGAATAPRLRMAQAAINEHARRMAN